MLKSMPSVFMFFMFLLFHVNSAFCLDVNLIGLGGIDVRVPLTWIADTTENLDSNLGPGDYGRILQFDGKSRFYEIHVPPSYDGLWPVPVVLVFHGGGGYPDAVRYQSGMDSISDEKGFIVVYPAGTGKIFIDRFLMWNDGRPFKDGSYSQVDDVGFVAAVLDDLETLFYIDPKRVYACGISNGAQFSYRLANQLSDRIAAIAAVAGHRAVDDIFPSPLYPIPVMQFSGKKDIYFLYYGGSPFSVVQSIMTFAPILESVGEAIQSWVAFDGCSYEPAEVTRIGRAVKTRYRPCHYGVEVVLWTLEDGGHTWPGGNVFPSEILVGVGKVNQDISASVLIWEFFEKFQLN